MNIGSSVHYSILADTSYTNEQTQTNEDSPSNTQNETTSTEDTSKKTEEAKPVNTETSNKEENNSLPAKPVPVKKAKKISIKVPKGKNIKKKGNKVTLRKRKTIKLSLLNYKGKAIWKSSNKKIATVKNGKVKFKKPGQVTISVKVKGKTYKIKIIYKKRYSLIEGHLSANADRCSTPFMDH